MFCDWEKTVASDHLVMQTTGVFVLTEGRNEKIHCDPVASYCSRDWICPRELEITSLAVYFCKDPCAWSDVKAHTAIIESYRRGMGLDDRFTLTKDRQVGRWMTVFISSVQSGDVGTYWCALDLRGKDWYQKTTVEVTKPPPEPVKVLQQDVTQTIDDDELALTSGTDSDRQKAARRAMKMCGGNKACALAVLQRDDLGVNTSCRLCLQLSHACKVIPLLSKDVKETVCHIPGQMTRLLQVQDSLLKGKVPKRTTLCSTPLLTATSSPFRVEPRKGEVCVITEQNWMLATLNATAWSQSEITSRTTALLTWMGSSSTSLVLLTEYGKHLQRLYGFVETEHITACPLCGRGVVIQLWCQWDSQYMQLLGRMRLRRGQGDNCQVNWWTLCQFGIMATSCITHGRLQQKI